jgi:hypothetical protein
MNKDLLEKLEKERQRVLADKKKWKEQVLQPFNTLTSLVTKKIYYYKPFIFFR